MALTNALVAHGGKQPSAPLIALMITVTPDASYPAATGGWEFDPGAILQSLGNYDKAPTELTVVCEPVANYTFEYDRANTKLKAYVPAGTEVPNTTDLSTTPGPFRAAIFAL